MPQEGRESTVARGVRSNRHACFFRTTLGRQILRAGWQARAGRFLGPFGMTWPRRRVSSGVAWRMPAPGVSTDLPPAPGFVGDASDWSGYA
jgi:hypothetical protein